MFNLTHSFTGLSPRSLGHFALGLQWHSMSWQDHMMKSVHIMVSGKERETETERDRKASILPLR